MFTTLFVVGAQKFLDPTDIFPINHPRQVKKPEIQETLERFGWDDLTKPWGS